MVYLVDSLWDCGGALLKDWPAITSILLQEPSADCQGLVVISGLLWLFKYSCSPSNSHSNNNLSSIIIDGDKCDCVAGLTEAQQAVLVEVLLATVRQVSEGPPLAGRSGAKKVCLTFRLFSVTIALRGSLTLQVISAREKKLQLDDCNKLTEHLVVVLPKLLSKVPIFSHYCVCNV